MENIKNLVKENLNLRFKLNESSNKLSIIEDYDVRFLHSMNVVGDLFEEGHSEESINTILCEQNWFSNLFGMNKKEGDNLDKSLETAGSGAMSQLKEFLIMKLLGQLGFEGPFVNALSTTLSEIPVTDMVNVFRGKENCEKISGRIVLAVGEGLVRYMIENVTKGNETFAAGFFRNIGTEFIKKQGYDKKLSPIICNFIQSNIQKLF